MVLTGILKTHNPVLVYQVEVNFIVASRALATYPVFKPWNSHRQKFESFYTKISKLGRYTLCLEA